MNPTKLFANLDKLVDEIEALKKANNILSTMLSMIIDEGEPVAEVAQVWRNSSKPSDDRHDQAVWDAVTALRQDLGTLARSSEAKRKPENDGFLRDKVETSYSRNGMMFAAEELTSANLMRVEVGTDGYCEGDSACHVYFKIEDLGGTSLDAEVERDRWGDADSVTIRLTGGTEYDTFREALRFAADTLDSFR